jgi:hypothetical protein
MLALGCVPSHPLYRGVEKGETGNTAQARGSRQEIATTLRLRLRAPAPVIASESASGTGDVTIKSCTQGAKRHRYGRAEPQRGARPLYQSTGSSSVWNLGEGGSVWPRTRANAPELDEPAREAIQREDSNDGKDCTPGAVRDRDAHRDERENQKGEDIAADEGEQPPRAVAHRLRLRGPPQG